LLKSRLLGYAKLRYESDYDLRTKSCRKVIFGANVPMGMCNWRYDVEIKRVMYNNWTEVGER